MRRRIAAKDCSQPHASLRPFQGLVERVFLNHEREGAFDGFCFCLGTTHGLRARQLRLIELEMFVPFRGAVSMVPPRVAENVHTAIRYEETSHGSRR